MGKSDLKIDWATHEAAKYACQNWHYSKCLPVGKLVKVGAWENEKFIGVVIFSRGANKSLGSPYGLSQTEFCELTRVALTNHVSPVTRIVKIAIKFLKKNSPNIRLVISFADPEQGHVGAIYQAGNWVYSGMTTPSEEYVYNGKRWHGRAFRKSFGSHLNFLDKGLTVVMGSSKHRYLMPLDDDMRRTVKGFSKSYPKRSKQAMADSNQHSGAAAAT